MDRQTFLHYLQQPKALTSLPREDLLALAEAYPHAANIRLLLALKARQENDPEADVLMERFAASTFDRPHLFDLLRQTDRPEAVAPEVLELRELEELELVPAGEIFDEIPSRLNDLHSITAPPTPLPPITSPPVDSPYVNLELEVDEIYSEDEAVKAVTLPARNLPEWVDLAADFHAVVVASVALGLRDTGPEDPGKFAHLIALRNGNKGLTDRLRSFRARATTGTEEVVTPRSDHPAVISETLADLLTRQGQYAHAIKMYRRLVLLYPEKKTIFAGLIQELKQKL